ncbi:hypothetical protein [Pseudoxanthomonas sp. PXM01]|uniref:hypothetical protein n=1 Tax=Pseudoxanthomonas sp. PXM01 TaxID=2769295 RepID=UPI0017866958|nr:hypothetical protein [Pseudoxanthomonas sp. PXM01]MBD9470965.1 hypothetical protein [Pseudoxanthomonas sp. PXM01]
MQGMKRIAVRAVWLLSALACPSLVLAQEDAPAPMDDAQIAQALLDAEATGRAIYLHDQAAAVASDAVMTLKAFRQDGKQGRLGGWITEQRDEGIAVTFLSSDAEPRARYRVTVGSEGRVIGDAQALAEPATLTPYELGAARARNTAAHAEFAPCSRSYNTVVLADPREGGGWIAYLLPGTTKQGVVPIGGSYRLDLDAAGQKIVRQRPFTRSCIALAGRHGEKDSETVAMMITHLLDPAPTEVHVFWSLWARTPMFVGTSAGLWKIENGRVTMTSRDEKESP